MFSFTVLYFIPDTNSTFVNGLRHMLVRIIASQNNMNKKFINKSELKIWRHTSVALSPGKNRATSAVLRSET